jgi:hypothetical protein
MYVWLAYHALARMEELAQQAAETRRYSGQNSARVVTSLEAFSS